MLKTEEITAINHFCAKHGSDLDLVQGQGGNFSIKGDNWMMIKASGLRLEEALEKNVFVTCDLNAIRKAYGVGNEDAIKDSVIDDLGLRPSIETSLHSVLPERFVFHFHSVAAIALTAQPILDDKLQALSKRANAPIVPYRKPGLSLAQAVEAAGVNHQAFILRNHGALVQAPTLELLLTRVELFRDEMGLNGEFERQFEATDTGWLKCDDLDLVFLGEMAKEHRGFANSNLYPDHPVILGPGIPTSENSDRFWYVDQKGLFIRNDPKSEASRPMIECLARVAKRLDFSSPDFGGLEADDVMTLLNWEAETYRQSLTAL